MELWSVDQFQLLIFCDDHAQFKNLSINARSIYASRCHNKLDELPVVASVHDFDILCVTESWLSSNVDNSCIPLSGYSEPFRLDRNYHGGVGVMAYVKRDLFCTRRRDLEQLGVEIMWLDFKLTHRNRLLIAVCYQPPNSAAADRFLFRMCYSNVIKDFLSDALNTILFVGDFNDHSIDKPFQQQTELFRLFNRFNFHQVIQSPTRCTNILDWFVI